MLGIACVEEEAHEGLEDTQDREDNQVQEHTSQDAVPGVEEGAMSTYHRVLKERCRNLEVEEGPEMMSCPVSIGFIQRRVGRHGRK